MLSSVEFALRCAGCRSVLAMSIAQSGNSIIESGWWIRPIGITPESVITIHRIP
jgi:hypothetical protein